MKTGFETEAQGKLEMACCLTDCEIIRSWMLIFFLKAHAQRGPQIRAQSGRKSPVCRGVWESWSTFDSAR